MDKDFRFSLDFNPRDFAVRVEPSSINPREALDAIFIPTRNRSAQISRLAEQISDLASNVFVLRTVESDYAPRHREASVGIQVLDWQHDDRFVESLMNLRTAANSAGLTFSGGWDLPIKRDYALWHARRCGFRRVLLLDDDMEISPQLVQFGTAVLSEFEACGFFVEDFPDTSIAGHIEIAMDHVVYTFVSGSCLFLRSDVEEMGFFPPLYNEDWMFLIPTILRSQLATAGTVRQLPYDPFADPAVAALQEPGEIICEGLFALLEADAYDQRHRRSVWKDLISLRREELTALATQTNCPAQVDCLTHALRRLDELSPEGCVEFVRDWESDLETWCLGMKGVS